MCPILKKLSKNLQPFREVTSVIKEILASPKGNDVRVLLHLLSYAEYQFGNQVLGIGYREREDGERISDWEVNIKILCNINSRIVEFFNADVSLSNISRHNKVFPSVEKTISLLSPWYIYLESDSSDENNCLSIDQKTHLLDISYFAERRMASLTMERNQFDVAEGHCQRSLVFSRRFEVEGKRKTTLIFQALRRYAFLRSRQGNDSGAVEIAEEAYNLVVEAYDCVHPQVQEAANLLIETLIKVRNFYDAERYAEATYGNLKDHKNGMDQESEAIARGAHSFADAICRKGGDLMKAERLAREALSIISRLYSSDDSRLAICCSLLAKILMDQEKLGDERKELFERALAINIRHKGPDGANTAGANINLGIFHRQLADVHTKVALQKPFLLQSKVYFEEAARIQTKIFSPTHPNAHVAVFALEDLIGDYKCLWPQMQKYKKNRNNKK
jgi:tetratricopeptide (TPR) repeat protein